MEPLKFMKVMREYRDQLILLKDSVIIIAKMYLLRILQAVVLLREGQLIRIIKPEHSVKLKNRHKDY